MSKINVSASDSMTSAVLSTTSIFSGAEGTLFDKLRSTRGEIERSWTFFKSMHRRFHKEGRTPANAEDRRDCDNLQINLAMQLNDFLGHIKSEWEENPTKITKDLVDNVSIYVEKKVGIGSWETKNVPRILQ